MSNLEKEKDLLFFKAHKKERVLSTAESKNEKTFFKVICGMTTFVLFGSLVASYFNYKNSVLEYEAQKKMLISNAITNTEAKSILKRDPVAPADIKITNKYSNFQLVAKGISLRSESLYRTLSRANVNIVASRAISIILTESVRDSLKNVNLNPTSIDKFNSKELMLDAIGKIDMINLKLSQEPNGSFNLKEQVELNKAIETLINESKILGSSES